MLSRFFLFFLCVALCGRATPVSVIPVTASHGMVVAAHPQATAAGVEVLKKGGNAIDAAVAVSLAVGVAEPYGSGLGGKFMLLYFEAKSGKTLVVEAMDACGTAIDLAKYRELPVAARSYGYSSVCVPGLAAGLWTAHQKWGARPWAEDIAPAIALAREGFEILPKTRDQFEEQEKKLRRGDAEIARLYLVGGALPAIGSKLKSPDLAHTMELLATNGRDGFYRGPVAAAIVSAAQKGGGVLTLEDFAHFEARIVEPVAMDFRGVRLVCAPPPALGPAIFLSILKALEDDNFSGGPLRSSANLDRLGRVWRTAEPPAWRAIGDVPEARFNLEKLLAPDSIRAIREKARDAKPARAAVDWAEGSAQDLAASTTQWMIVDAQGNIACCTQSLSLHFGAGVVAPGTGVVLNDTMSDFAFDDAKSVNLVAPGKRPRSTISPTIAFRGGKPAFAIGVPGGARIPTAMLQALLDHLALGRPLADAIGDTRIHFVPGLRRGEPEAFEAEQSLPEETVAGLRALGWNVVLPEAAGTGRHFGGINAIQLNPDGTLTGFADPRRTNFAAGW